MSYTGSCACGSVKYAFDVEPFVTVTCHCSICRKATGSACATWTLVLKDHFRWSSGADQLQEIQSSSHGRRFFCGHCGSSLGNLSEMRPAYMHIGAGTLDHAPDLRVACHVYVASKAPWLNISDDLPQFDELPPKS